MFKVRVIVRRFSNPELLAATGSSTAVKGQVFETDRDHAYYLAGLGCVEIIEGDDLSAHFETKDGPASLSPPDLLPAKPSSALSPAGPASPSTTPTESSPKPTRSTRPTGRGGRSTSPKSVGTLRASSGAVTAKRVGTLVSEPSGSSDAAGLVSDRTQFGKAGS